MPTTFLHFPTTSSYKKWKNEAKKKKLKKKDECLGSFHRSHYIELFLSPPLNHRMNWRRNWTPWATTCFSTTTPLSSTTPSPRLPSPPANLAANPPKRKMASCSTSSDSRRFPPSENKNWKTLFFCQTHALYS